MATESRGRDTDREQTLKLCTDDRKKLWQVLDAELPSRVRRIELGIVALIVMNGAKVIPQIPAVISHFGAIGGTVVAAFLFVSAIVVR